MAEIQTPPKRLVDLNPRWRLTTDGEVYGIEYDCPCGLPTYDPKPDANGEYDKVKLKLEWEASCKNLGRQLVPTKTNFHPDKRPSSARSIEVGWDLSGTSFGTLTLSPSIHQVGHWHGHVQNGMVISC